MNRRHVLIWFAGFGTSPGLAGLPEERGTWIEYWDDERRIPWLRCHRVSPQELGVPNLARSEPVPRTYIRCEELQPSLRHPDFR